MKKIFSINISILTLLICLQPTNLQAQTPENVRGIPYIQNIHLKKYGIENQNFSIVQDTNGILFIGNSNGILEYNGYYWELMETRGLPYLARFNEKIYFGAYNALGSLQYDQRQLQPSYIDIPEKEGSTGQTKKLFSIDTGLIWVTNNRLSLLYEDNSQKSIPLEPNDKIFALDNSQVLLYNEDLGLFNLDTRNLTTQKILDKSNLPATIEELTNYGDSILVSLNKNNGLGFLNNGHFRPFQSQANQILNQTSITDIISRGDTIFLGTQSEGIILINGKGDIVDLLNEKNGLFDAKINKLFIDRNKNLWALHDGGLSRVEINAGLLYYNHMNGIRGNINSIIKYQNKLYLTTSKGVYIVKNFSGAKKNNVTYQKVKGINANCYDLYKFNDELIVSTEEGIYKIQNDQAFLFYNKFRKQFNSVHRYRKNPSLLIIGKEDGISIVKYTNGLFIYQGDITGIPYSVNSITEDKDGNIWFSAQHEGIHIINSFDGFSPDLHVRSYLQDSVTKERLKWKKLFSTSRGIYISTSEGLYMLDTINGELYRDTIIPREYTTNWIFPIIEDKDQNIWFNIVSREKLESKTLLVSSSEGNFRDIIRLPLNRIKNFSINTIQPERDHIVWLGGSDGLVRMDIKNINHRKMLSDLIIHKVILNNDSILTYNYYKKHTKSPPELTYQQNNIKFEFSSTHFISEQNIGFSTRLEGYETSWSNYTNQHFKEYRNLREGNYVFQLRTKNIYGQVSAVIEYPFSIEPPIYRTWYAYLIYMIFVGFVLFLIFKLRAYYFAKEKFKLENIINERTEEVLLQKEKADNLIERLLPKETVKELKSGRKAGPYHYNMVTVLFGDIKGFTKITERLEELNALDLLDKLDKYFLEFDSIVEKYNIEKIKTIGDAYMCAGGIPEENHTNPVEVIVAAMEMQGYMKKMKEEAGEEQGIWDLRIGVDTGSVIAGVIGRSKVTYDIWGSTVNLASRMEASGEPGKINITGNTYMMVKDFFICKYRGRMPVKNKGDIDMYFVENFKPQFSETLKGLQPNSNFYIQLQLLRFNDLEETILEKLEKGLPDDLYYHNVKHTIDVVTQVELIGKAENVSDEELLILKTAALFHDVGHLVSYDNHEEESVKIAGKMLSKYHYSREQIEKIGKLILATKMPPEPETLLEKIICDADLDYLGRTDFVPVAYNLYKELLTKKKISSFEEWKKLEIDFIKKHSYFTETAQNLREVNKRRQLEKIVKEMKPENGQNSLS